MEIPQLFMCLQHVLCQSSYTAVYSHYCSIVEWEHTISKCCSLGSWGHCEDSTST